MFDVIWCADELTSARPIGMVKIGRKIRLLMFLRGAERQGNAENAMFKVMPMPSAHKSEKQGATVGRARSKRFGFSV